MTWKYTLLGIPQNIDETIDLLNKSNIKEAVLNVTESQHKDRIVYSANISLGKKPIIGDIKYIVEEQDLLFVTQIDAFNTISDAQYLKEKVMNKAQETIKYLKGRGIEAKILENKEFPWKGNK